MNRGGNRGQGRGGGEKRKPNTPVGGQYKDQRRGLNSDEMEYDEEEEEWSVVSYNRKSPQRQQPNQPNQHQTDTTTQSDVQSNQERPTFASVAAQPSSSSMQNRRSSTTSANYNPRKVLQKMFVTPAPEGPMRDEITIEVQTINGKPFKGTLTFHEALDGIYKRCLELDNNLLHGIRFRFSKCPTIKYKLKEQINIDELQRIEYFEFYRNYTVKGEPRHDTFGCKINGIRTSSSQETNVDSDQDPNVRWVKIEWTEYAVQEKQILEWLHMYGEEASELSEDIHPNSDSDADPVGSGTYSIKMRLKKEIPQLLPMWGKRIRIYYRGVTKLCPNCFGTHPRKNCRSEKVSWIQYVLRFMESNPEVPPEFYGKWWKIVNEEFGEIIPDEVNQIPIEETPQNDSVAEAQRAPDASVPLPNQRPQLPTNAGSNSTQTSTERLSRIESENLADYLRIGMSIKEAREAFKKELEMAELKQKIRDSKRSELRGQSRTTIGATYNNRGGGRGGLSFN